MELSLEDKEELKRHERRLNSPYFHPPEKCTLKDYGVPGKLYCTKHNVNVWAECSWMVHYHDGHYSDPFPY